MPLPTTSPRQQLFTRPARQVARELEVVGKKVERFTADKKLTRDERKSLNAELKKATAMARPMVAGQSEPVLELVEEMKKLISDGKLTKESADALKQLRRERTRVVERASAAAGQNPLDKKGWKRPFHGVAKRDFTYQGVKVHAVAIDLADPRVSLLTNSEGQRGKNVDTFAKNAGAEVAINGDFFSYGSYKPSGVAKTNGHVWKGTEGGKFEGFLGFSGRHAEVRGSNQNESSWARNMVSARPTVLLDGKSVLTDPAKNAPNARTGVGLSRNGRVLYLVATEGRAGKGLTATGVGQLLKSLGADDAMAMDAGGSAQMYVKGRGMVQRSTDPGGRRAVANVVMVNSR